MSQKPAITQHQIRDHLVAMGIHNMSKIPKSSAARIDAFFRECPVRHLLPLYSGNNGVTITHVSRLTEDVIIRDLLHEREYHWEHVFLLDENWEVVTHVTETEYQCPKYLFFGPVVSRISRKYTLGLVKRFATILDVLESLGSDADRVKYAVSYHEWTGAVIVYKRIRDMNLVGLKAELAARVRDSYREEFNRQGCLIKHALESA